MRLSELSQAFGLTALTPALIAAASGRPPAPSPGEAIKDPDITCGYASDLLSDVLAHAPAGAVLLTMQVHLNVIAVAEHTGLAAVIFTASRRPDDDILARALEESIALFASPADTFELAGRLYQSGIRGAGP